MKIMAANAEQEEAQEEIEVEDVYKRQALANTGCCGYFWNIRNGCWIATDCWI